MVHPPSQMNTITGLRALAVAVVTEVTGTTAGADHGIEIALITAASGVGAVCLQLFVGNYLQARRERRATYQPKEEQTPQRVALAHIETVAAANEELLEALVASQAEVERLEARLRRRKR
jgi:hypothetical protein